MNKSIKEYAQQAGFMTFKDGRFTEEEAIEKFAQLMIEKCCKLTNTENLVIANEPKHVIKAFFNKKG
jgi:hypothetical protein